MILDSNLAPALRHQRDAVAERNAEGLSNHLAVERLRALGESFQTTDVPKEKADGCMRVVPAAL